MGLDILHNKATLQRPITTEPYELGVAGVTEDAFYCFDVPFSHFEKYIQKIDRPKIIKKGVVVNDASYLEKAIRTFKNTDCEIFFEKTENSLKQKLMEYESKNKLTQLSRHYIEVAKGWSPLYYYEVIKKVGFYIIEAGYQRKGMNSNFRYFYQDGKNSFVLREDFERAYECIEAYWDQTKEQTANRKNDFKQNFLDNYEFGASYLFVSY